MPDTRLRESPELPYALAPRKSHSRPLPVRFALEIASIVQFMRRSDIVCRHGDTVRPARKRHATSATLPLLAIFSPSFSVSRRAGFFVKAQQVDVWM
jgi:hypothetical protein